MGWTQADLDRVYRRRGEQQLAQQETFAKTSRTGPGKREDLGGQYFRSTWEANIARYLNHLVAIGALLKWEYEIDEWFFPTERGIRQYKCDFKLWWAADPENPVYWEVKGYMDAPSKRKLNLMAKYYPKVKIIIIGPAEYRNIAAQASGLPHWETGEFKARAKRRFS